MHLLKASLSSCVPNKTWWSWSPLEGNPLSPANKVEGGKLRDKVNRICLCHNGPMTKPLLFQFKCTAPRSNKNEKESWILGRCGNVAVDILNSNRLHYSRGTSKNICQKSIVRQVDGSPFLPTPIPQSKTIPFPFCTDLVTKVQENTRKKLRLRFLGGF